MLSIYDIKPAFQRLLRPLSSGLHRAGVRPNHVTLAALALAIAVGVALTWRAGEPRLLLALPAVLFVRMALNAIDGMMAREHDQTTPLGAMLNEVGDGISDVALYLPLALWPGFDGAAVALLAVLAVLTELTGVAAVAIGASRRYDGPMGKSDRAFWMGLIALLLGLGVEIDRWLPALLWAIVGLLAVTVVRRIQLALREVRDEPA